MVHWLRYLYYILFTLTTQRIIKVNRTNVPFRNRT
nr:MAG TPA: hypothetical protein [Caudoviricetes sp.]